MSAATQQFIALLVAAIFFVWAGVAATERFHKVCVEGAGWMTRDGWDGECYRYERRPGPDMGNVLLLGALGAVALYVSVEASRRQ